MNLTNKTKDRTVNDDRQLALMLFDSLSQQNKNITSAPTSLGYRRNNALVQIVDLSLAGRRLLDVAYFIVATESEVKKTYSIELGLFKWLLGTTSDNRAHIKRLIREAQMAAIELNGTEIQSDNTYPWGSIPLMGTARISNGRFIFDLAEELQLVIRDPRATHFLALRYVFKSVYTKILYDRLQPYMQEGATPWFGLETLRIWLECNKKTYELFKHFRSRVLDVAIAEIHEVTGLEITMVTQNVPGSKKVNEVRFVWDENNRADEQKAALVILKTLYETLRNEIGLSHADIDEIIKDRARYSDEVIQQAIDYTRHAAAAGKIKIRVSGYFMKALREGYIIGTLDQDLRQRKAIAAADSQAGADAKDIREKSADREFTAKHKRDANAGWEAFEAMSVDDQNKLARAFANLSTSALFATRLGIETHELIDHLQEPIVHQSFGAFVTLQLQQQKKAAKMNKGPGLFASDNS
ncbi:RepB family plasmid replication initiator protein [Pseudoduganella sp. CY13W]|uniref:RepB family plasmid replication initiator protein n=1 Tax=Duganella qianjiadongensis TaxID=2692176 RepID=A0ABW9VSH1_9BURK|nr:RepB family plasmid replication initiator protein [Duganella qianjiadongensis]